MPEADHPWAGPPADYIPPFNPNPAPYLTREQFGQRQAILRANARHRLRAEASWRYQAPPEPAETPLGGKGLSNAPYLHAASSIAKRPNRAKKSHPPHAAGLQAELSWRPGTAKLRILGRFLSRVSTLDALRGRIKRLSAKSTARLSELTREFEAQDIKPEYMITLTYPRDWQGDLSAYEAEKRQKLKALLGELNLLRRRVASARRVPHTTERERQDALGILDTYQNTRQRIRHAIESIRYPQKQRLRELLIELDRRRPLVSRARRQLKSPYHAQRAASECVMAAYKELRGDVRRMLHEARMAGPNGRVLKRHLKTFRARFERRYGTTWSAAWWLEFQRRRAPHVHLILWNSGGVFGAGQAERLVEVRRWVSRAWAEVVAGEDLADYQDPRLNDLYDTWREFAGPETADEMLVARGLDLGRWNHLRAGTRVEKMIKPHWGYLAAEASGGRAKGYQKTVPRNYQNVGRWWGYWRHKRVPPTSLKYDVAEMSIGEMCQMVVAPMEAALAALPKACFKFIGRARRLLNGFLNREAFGYLTIWGQRSVRAMLAAVPAGAG